MPTKPPGRDLYGFLAGDAIGPQPIGRPGVNLGVIRSYAIVPIQVSRTPPAAQVPTVVVQAQRAHGQARGTKGERDHHPRRAIGVLVVPVFETRYALAQLTEESGFHSSPSPVATPRKARPWLIHITYLRCQDTGCNGSKSNACRAACGA
jgi:hypothetical protein